MLCCVLCAVCCVLYVVLCCAVLYCATLCCVLFMLFTMLIWAVKAYQIYSHLLHIVYSLLHLNNVQ